MALTASYSSTSKYAAMAKTPYPLNLPRWGWSNQSVSPTGGTNLAPYSQPTDAGYDVNATRLNQSRRDTAYKRANGKLSDGDFQYPMFVTDVNIDIALSGSTAQSALTRDFYPRNFVLPSFTISGQSLDQNDYGLLCEFVHQAQRKMIIGGWQNLTQLHIAGWGFDGNRRTGYAVTQNGGTLMKPGTWHNQSIRGSHQPILCKGVVTTMPREHQQGVYAPTWEFGFVVLGLLAGLYQEPIDVAVAEQTWITILQAVADSPGVVSSTAAQLADNKKKIQAINRQQGSPLLSATAASGTQSGH